MVSCLLIEENAEERGRLLPLLHGLGLDCDARPQAEEGIRFCRAHMPDVIIMEARTRPATQEFLRQVRLQAQGRSGPVVILYSATPDLQNIGASILEGAAEFMAKPFDRNLMRFKLEQAGILPH